MPDLLEKAKQTIEAYQMLPRGASRVLLGVSGGPDSMVMADLFRRLAKEARLFLFVAHLDHMFRGEESAGDALFVQKWAEHYGLPYFIEARDVPTLRESDESKQQAARRVRYQFFEECRRRADADKIALAHTLNDQAETVLMRMLSGGGLGLRGIPPVRDEYIRPLLRISRQEILDYAAEHGIQYRIDPSNLKPDYLRNKIRLQLVPYLVSNYNPKVQDALARSAEILRAEDEYLDKQVSTWVKDNVQTTFTGDVLPVQQLAQTPLAIQRRVVSRLLSAVGGREITFNHVEDVLALTKSCQGTHRLDLPGLRVIREYDRLRIEPIVAREAPQGQMFSSVQLAVPGETVLPGYSLTISATIHQGGPSELKRLRSESQGSAGQNAFFDLETINLPLLVRTVTPGDSFTPFGLGGTKKIHDFFSDEKVIRDLRDKIPLVTNDQGILWIVGMRSSELGRITARTHRILHLAVSSDGCQDMGGMI